MITSGFGSIPVASTSGAVLNDVEESTFPTERNVETYDKSRGWPQWFMRGWTLQELIAPNQIVFFNRNWAPIGNKQHLAPVLKNITSIPRDVLRDGLVGKRLSVAQIMSWAALRKTTRVEDRAYSLMGLFGVNMPMLYGEGKKAFRRLQLEIIREFDDHSIFAWEPWTRRAGSFLAEDPSDFWRCGDAEKVEPDEFGDELVRYMEPRRIGNPWYIQLNSRKISTNPIHHCRLAWLKWRAHALTQQLRTFMVSNAGIQVCLPVIPLPDSPSHFRAILACTSWGQLVTIDIVYSGSGIYSIPGHSVSGRKAYPKFRTLHLAHNQDINEKHRKFTLDDQHASYHEFTRCGTYPHEFTEDTVALSFLVDDLVIVVYANENTRSYFAVGLGYHLGQGWVHIVCDEDLPTQDVDWAEFGKRAYGRMWRARAKHAQNMSKQERAHLTRNTHFVKHAHFPRSILAARVVWGRWELDNLRVMVDVEQCLGCCDGPCGMTTTFSDWGGLAMPGLMNTVRHPYSLELDGWQTQVDKCSGQRLSLGDYGDCVDGTLTCTGNIFRDMRIIGIDPEDSAYQPVVSCLSGDRWVKFRMTNQGDIATAYHSTSRTTLVLHRARGISLPTNKHIALLLKAFSTRLSGKHLVTTLIQCSDIYSVDRDGNRIDSGDDVLPDSGMHAAEPGILTPFCAIASPQVWRREPPCVQRRAQFRNIRKHFYALVDIHQLTGHGLCRKLATRRKKDRATKFFSDMFGLKYFRNYIGEITFLARLPCVMNADPPSDISSVCATEEDGLLPHSPTLSRANWATRYNLLWGRQRSNAVQSDARHKVALPLLSRRCQILRPEYDTPRRYTGESRKVECELKSIMQTQGAGLLQYIMTTFCNLFYELRGTGIAVPANIDYDKQLNTPSVVQEIEALQVKLDALEDEDEQRVLEEDITGKILWLCWCGICAEADELLPKVVDYLRRRGNIEGLRGMSEIMVLTMYTDEQLRMLGVPSMDRNDDRAHLRRIMLDAGANTPKYQLLLAVRAAEQAKWSGANKGVLATENQGTTLSTSPQGPSESVV